MSSRVLIATFDHEDDLLAATTAVRERGLRIMDIYTPYAVHGLDRAMGLKPSRLTWVCFVCGMAGALGMLWFEHWTAAINWPINVGGKPWFALPSDAPIAFEAAVLLAGFGTVFALFGVARMWPGKQPRKTYPRTTDDRFVLVIGETNAAFDVQSVEQMLTKYDVLKVEEQLVT